MIDAHWPADGPHTPQALDAAASALAEVCRYLARATHGRRALADPDTAYDVIGQLAAAAPSLHQALNQIADRIGEWADDAALRDDQHDAQSATRSRAVNAARDLRTSAAGTAELRNALDAAQSGLSHLCLATPQEGTL